MITIIDLGFSNIKSVKNILNRIGIESLISSDLDIISESEKLILPGVGSYDAGMAALEMPRLIDTLNRRVLQDKVPILGICLGAQLFCKRSDEGKKSGLGWVDANVYAFDKKKLSGHDKVPHMGWTEIKSRKQSKLLEGLEEEARFYFVHSYHIGCSNNQDVLATSCHGYDFVSAVEKDNIIGVQFHPEKSHKFGMKLLHNFAIKY